MPELSTSPRDRPLDPADASGTRRRAWRPELVWLAVVVAALLVIYLPGVGNALIYDDSYLTEGLFHDYASPLHVQVRMLSYGSFVWLHALFGDGWWKQRLANLAIHTGTVVALASLYKEVLRHIAAPASESGSRAPPYERSPALFVAVGFFALNPVAVYAVAYLIQRSILLATLFSVLALWAFARGLRLRNPALHALAVTFYALAVASKEHAILLPLAALPLYVVIARPGTKRLALLAVAGVAIIAVAAAALYLHYGDILGRPFDDYSRVYLHQLARLDPGAERHAWLLSILNEAWLFFRYGLDWMVPYAGWLSINLRPPFPVTWHTFPQILGIVGYVAVLIGGFALVVRYRDGRALLGLSLLFPALLFATEFATVWVQDPYSLYRSYLWAIGIPGIVFFILHGPSARALAAIGTAIAALLVWQALDRVLSMESPVMVWTDAIAKLGSDPRAVGRWFPYLNRGSAYVDLNRFDLALRDFEVSSALGDEGMGAFNMGAVLSAQGHQAEALAAFDRAQREGYDLYNLPFQRGLALAHLGRLDEAYRQFQTALAANPPSPTREYVLLETGRVAMRLHKADAAVAALEKLVAAQPAHEEARYLLGMAYVMKGEAARALPVLDGLVHDAPNARSYYARAAAAYSLGLKARALKDIDAAVQSAPGNAALREWQAKIRAMP